MRCVQGPLSVPDQPHVCRTGNAAPTPGGAHILRDAMSEYTTRRSMAAGIDDGANDTLFSFSDALAAAERDSPTLSPDLDFVVVLNDASARWRGVKAGVEAAADHQWPSSASCSGHADRVAVLTRPGMLGHPVSAPCSPAVSAKAAARAAAAAAAPPFVRAASSIVPTGGFSRDGRSASHGNLQRLM